MITEKELISKLQDLRQIKPTTEWVSLTRQEIFGRTEMAQNRNAIGFWQRVESLFIQKKLAYAFAAFMLIFAGVMGFIKYGDPHNNLGTAALVAMDSSTKNSVEEFKSVSQNYAQAVKTNKSVSLAATEVKSAAQNLTDAIKKDPTMAKQVALEVNNNKTLLDVSGSGEVKDSSNDLYKTIDEQMINDLQKSTLTDDQKKTLKYINDLFNQGKYDSALENILLMNAANSSAK